MVLFISHYWQRAQQYLIFYIHLLKFLPWILLLNQIELISAQISKGISVKITAGLAKRMNDHNVLVHVKKDDLTVWIIGAYMRKIHEEKRRCEQEQQHNAETSKQYASDELKTQIVLVKGTDGTTEGTWLADDLRWYIKRIYCI